MNRGFKTFADAINAAYSINTGTPAMELPADGIALNRILKLTQTIQQAVIDLLKEEDARNSWKEKYNKIVFSNSGVLTIEGTASVITIHFPFNDIDAPEISVKELTEKMMAVL